MNKRNPFEMFLTFLEMTCKIVNSSWSIPVMGAIGISHLHCVAKIVQRLELESEETERFQQTIRQLMNEYDANVVQQSLEVIDGSLYMQTEPASRGSLMQAILLVFADLCHRYSKLTPMAMVNSGNAELAMISNLLRDMDIPKAEAAGFQALMNELKATASGNDVIGYIRAVERELQAASQETAPVSEVAAAEEIEKAVIELTAQQLRIPEDEVDHETIIPDPQMLIMLYHMKSKDDCIVLNDINMDGMTVGKMIVELTFAEH